MPQKLGLAALKMAKTGVKKAIQTGGPSIATGLKSSAKVGASVAQPAASSTRTLSPMLGKLATRVSTSTTSMMKSARGANLDTLRNMGKGLSDRASTMASSVRQSMPEVKAQASTTFSSLKKRATGYMKDVDASTISDTASLLSSNGDADPAAAEKKPSGLRQTASSLLHSAKERMGVDTSRPLSTRLSEKMQDSASRISASSTAAMGTIQSAISKRFEGLSPEAFAKHADTARDYLSVAAELRAMGSGYQPDDVSTLQQYHGKATTIMQNLVGDQLHEQTLKHPNLLKIGMNALFHLDKFGEFMHALGQFKTSPSAEAAAAEMPFAGEEDLAAAMDGPEAPKNPVVHRPAEPEKLATPEKPALPERPATPEKPAAPVKTEGAAVPMGPQQPPVDNKPVAQQAKPALAPAAEKLTISPNVPLPNPGLDAAMGKAKPTVPATPKPAAQTPQSPTDNRLQLHPTESSAAKAEAAALKEKLQDKLGDMEAAAELPFAGEADLAAALDGPQAPKNPVVHRPATPEKPAAPVKTEGAAVPMGPEQPPVDNKPVAQQAKPALAPAAEKLTISPNVPLPNPGLDAAMGKAKPTVPATPKPAAQTPQSPTDNRLQLHPTESSAAKAEAAALKEKLQDKLGDMEAAAELPFAGEADLAAALDGPEAPKNPVVHRPATPEKPAAPVKTEGAAVPMGPQQPPVDNKPVAQQAKPALAPAAEKLTISPNVPLPNPGLDAAMGKAKPTVPATPKPAAQTPQSPTDNRLQLHPTESSAAKAEAAALKEKLQDKLGDMEAAAELPFAGEADLAAAMDGPKAPENPVVHRPPQQPTTDNRLQLHPTESSQAKAQTAALKDKIMGKLDEMKAAASPARPASTIPTPPPLPKQSTASSSSPAKSSTTAPNLQDAKARLKEVTPGKAHTPPAATNAKPGQDTLKAAKDNLKKTGGLGKPAKPAEPPLTEAQKAALKRDNAKAIEEFESQKNSLLQADGKRTSLQKEFDDKVTDGGNSFNTAAGGQPSGGHSNSAHSGSRKFDGPSHKLPSESAETPKELSELDDMLSQIQGGTAKPKQPLIPGEDGYVTQQQAPASLSGTGTSGDLSEVSTAPSTPQSDLSTPGDRSGISSGTVTPPTGVSTPVEAEGIQSPEARAAAKSEAAARQAQFEASLAKASTPDDFQNRINDVVSGDPQKWGENLQAYSEQLAKMSPTMSPDAMGPLSAHLATILGKLSEDPDRSNDAQIRAAASTLSKAVMDSQAQEEKLNNEGAPGASTEALQRNTQLREAALGSITGLMAKAQMQPDESLVRGFMDKAMNPQTASGTSVSWALATLPAMMKNMDASTPAGKKQLADLMADLADKGARSMDRINNPGDPEWGPYGRQVLESAMKAQGINADDHPNLKSALEGLGAAKTKSQLPAESAIPTPPPPPPMPKAAEAKAERSGPENIQEAAYMGQQAQAKPASAAKPPAGVPTRGADFLSALQSAGQKITGRTTPTAESAPASEAPAAAATPKEAAKPATTPAPSAVAQSDALKDALAKRRASLGEDEE